jgi:hypothetical protein
MVEKALNGIERFRTLIEILMIAGVLLAGYFANKEVFNTELSKINSEINILQKTKAEEKDIYSLTADISVMKKDIERVREILENKFREKK